ncbi:MAG TPA: DUF2141 domain-containing protein [Acidobacteriaceae bacterium]|jgi:uncharacterized protein (DUF2141 family)|nr:DUF2141 domain-containing protein [Acidobacteriaceae bacterium]
MQRAILLVAGLVALCGAAQAQQEDAPRYSAAATAGQPLCTLRIHVTGFRNNKGDAGGTVFASANGWPEQNSKSVVHGPFPIANQQATEEFHLPAGKYAVAVIHDENMNHKLDRNFLGIPKEGFGFANNPKVGLSAPSFETAVTQVSCPVTEIEIRLIYKF